MELDFGLHKGLDISDIPDRYLFEYLWAWKIDDKEIVSILANSSGDNDEERLKNFLESTDCSEAY